MLYAVEDKTAVLASFAASFRPMAWSGRLSDVLGPYRQFAETLERDPDQVIASWASVQVETLTRRIESDVDRTQPTDESFE
jgi:hypothetical protein